MNVLYWNCRGIHNFDTQRMLFQLVESNKPDILCLSEPMVNFSVVRASFWQSLGMDLIAVNTKPVKSLWVFQSTSSLNHFSVVSCSDQFVLLQTTILNSSHFVCLVYGSVWPIQRQNLYSEIIDLKRRLTGNWLLLGDFNAVLGAHERRGQPPPARPCREFREFLDNGDLQDIAPTSSFFTCSNGRYGSARVDSRLDRALISEDFCNLWTSLSCVILPRHFSDHHPIIFTCTEGVRRIPRFRFQGMWITHDGIRGVIKNFWDSQHPALPPMPLLCHKLKGLRPILRNWNKDVFGNFNVNIATCEATLNDIQINIASNGFSDSLYQEEIAAHTQLNLHLKQKEIYYKERSRVQWLSNGDRNSSFFHKMASTRKQQAGISTMNVGGTVSVDQSTISAHIIEFYSALFSNPIDRQPDLSRVQEIIPSLVSNDDNNMLVQCPTDSEICVSVSSMNGSSAPGPDGFTGVFYQTFWDIVGPDVCNMVRWFFHHGVISTGLNSNLMVLLPKVEGAMNIEQYRPIVMSNFSFKIISKILADRLAIVAAKIVSENQFGFIKGRSIHQCIAIASEGVNSLSKKCYGGHLAMKIDIQKAFDTLDWNFLLQVMESFGFSLKFRDWILYILSSARISIMTSNGTEGYFSCSREVRQGDPLSPLLFGIAEDFLSRLLSHLVDTGRLSPMLYSRNSYFPSHLLYADDILVFCAATVVNVRLLNDTFNFYGSISGQHVNWQKSEVFFSNSVLLGRQLRLANITGIKTGNLPFNYLGVPLFCGAPKARHLRPLADRVISQFSRWKGRTLSMAGRVTLVNFVIMGSLVHSFIVYKWHINLINEITRCIRNFIWTGAVDGRKLVTVPWNLCLRSQREGGLGLKNLQLMNRALLGKLAWGLISDKSLCYNLLRTRFLGVLSQPRLCIGNSSIWTSLKTSYSLLWDHCFWSIGADSNLLFWTSEWIIPTVATQLRIPSANQRRLNASIMDFRVGGEWQNLPQLPNDIRDRITWVYSGGDPNDICFWQPASNGVFTLKLFYSWMQSEPINPPGFKLIWRTSIPPSHSMVCWRAFLGYLPTHDSLRRRGIPITSRCSLCSNAMETQDHMFVHCTFSQEIWRSISSLFGRNIDSSRSLSGLIIAAESHRFSSQIQHLWFSAVVNAIWVIWFTRNKCIFEEERPNISMALRRLWAFIREADSLNKGATWNSIIELQILQALHLQVRSHRAPHILPVRWMNPSSGWWKVNTDASVTGSPGPAGCGGVFRVTVEQ
ncbi:DNAse I-like superfamily protein [Euphorbia peplus]|nr:DNAse I-like superfamily protein [Euphorbia peplus]